jgi:hypothetical protein
MVVIIVIKCHSNMKLILQMLANIIALLVILYLPFAFIVNNWNPTEWNIYIRGLYVLCFVAVITYGLEQYKKK